MSGHVGMLRDLNATDLTRTLNDHEHELVARQAAILRDAATGDEMARFVAKKVLRLEGWWSREQGNIVGDLTEVVHALEARGVVRFASVPSPLLRTVKRLGMRGGTGGVGL